MVTIDDATVTASPLLPATAAIDVHLDRQRDRDLPVVVRTALGTAEVVVPAFSKHATGTLTVPVGRPNQKVREVGMRANGAGATLTIRPPEQSWLEAARAATAQVRWPQVPLIWLF
jgi:hypothetical protein